MATSFTIKNTGDRPLEVKEGGEQGQGQGQGQGQPGQGQSRDTQVGPGEERTFNVDENSHLTVREGEQEAEPKRG